MGEMARVLPPQGRIVIIDVNDPDDDNRRGRCLMALWRRSGDVVRDMEAVFADAGLRATDEGIGGWGSVHLYVATRR